jgi:hypothetical protein
MYWEVLGLLCFVLGLYYSSSFSKRTTQFREMECNPRALHFKKALGYILLKTTTTSLHFQVIPVAVGVNARNVSQCY